MLLTFEFLFALLPDGGAGGTFFGTTFSPCFVTVLILGVPARMVTWPRGGLEKKAKRSSITSLHAFKVQFWKKAYIVLVARES